jgi:hypothetical protein
VSSVADVHQQAEQIKMWVEGRRLFSKTEEFLGVKLPTFWELRSGHFRVFLKTV